MEKSIIAIINNRFVSEGDTSEVVDVVSFATETATVKRGYGITLNLGNYESARIDVSIEVPCYVEDVERADEFARAWVEERVTREVRAVRGEDKDLDGKF